MTNRMKQVGLTIGLTVPLAISAATGGPFSASTTAQGASQMVGPNGPILLDTNNNGPTPGDQSATPTLNGTDVELPKQFSCQSQPNTTVHMMRPDPNGRFTAAARQNNSREQQVGVSNASGQSATSFVYTEADSRGTRANGTGAFMDTNGDGQADSFGVSGNVSAMVNLVFTPDSNYVSMPVSQVAMLGGATSTCGLGFVPQIWVPLADTNGDGRGDSVVFDLNGDGIPDPQFFSSPRLAGLSVPATSNMALAVLVALLGSIGVWCIGRYQPTTTTPGPRL